jgi:hypothetical protein
LAAALLDDDELVLREVYTRQVDARDFRPPHAGLQQRVDDGAVPPGPVALPSGALVEELGVPVAPAVAGPPADHRQVVGGIEEASALRHGEGALEIEPALLGEAFELQERMLPLRERPVVVDPFREGLQVGEHPVDRPVGFCEAIWQWGKNCILNDTIYCKLFFTLLASLSIIWHPPTVSPHLHSKRS